MNPVLATLIKIIANVFCIIFLVIDLILINYICRSDMCPPEGYKPTAPPPSYDDLLRSGRLPQDGTTVHLI